MECISTQFNGEIKMTKHTPTPWCYKFSEDMNGYENENYVLYSEEENLCAGNYYSTPGIEKEADAAFIVKAVNMHDELVKTLQEAADRLENLAGLGQLSNDKICQVLTKAKGET